MTFDCTPVEVAQPLQRRCWWSGLSDLGRTTFQWVIGLVPRLYRHPHVAKYTCVYDMQLLAVWHIPPLAVVLLLSLALHVGLLQTLLTSPCLSRFRNNLLEKRMLCTGLFSQVALFLGTLPVVDPSPLCTCMSDLLFAVAWPHLK